MIYTVKSKDNFNTEFAQDNIVKSVLQNVALLLATRKRTVPLCRDFGLEMEFIDKPIDVAETMAYSDVSEALEEFEPRAKLRDLVISKSAGGTMELEVKIEVIE